jgi:uncharacterized protein (TIGR01777 family)
MYAALGVLAAQGLVGALDNLLHHELTARLPSRTSARTELALHSVREGVYAVVFFCLAWAEWRGWWAWALAALLVLEIGVTIADFLVEDATRALPRFERALHTGLAVGYGAFLAAFAPVWLGWALSPAEVVPASYGLLSPLLTLYALGVGAWSVRNAVAVFGLSRARAEQAAKPLPAPSGRRVLVAGGTGFIGGRLVGALVARGDEVWVSTRDVRQARAQFGRSERVHAVDDLGLLPDSSRLDAVVNLAGAMVVGGLWTRARRKVLVESRTRTSAALVALMARLERKPEVFLAASAVGVYGVRGDERLDESASGQPIFMSALCQAAEAAAREAEQLGVRVVALRFGVVLGREGGLLPMLGLASFLGVGARLGEGRQWFPWIHIEDAVGLILHALDDRDLAGPINAVAPSSVRQGDFAAILARAQHRPLWLTVPVKPLRLALGEMSQLLLDGQRVIPQRALQAGYRFRWPALEDALEDLALGAKSSSDAETLASPSPQGGGGRGAG